MSVDSDRRLAARVARQPADAARERYDRATADLDPPLALVDEGAFDRNAADMVRRAALDGPGVTGSHPIRVATKSLRCRYLIERALATPGYRGVMCYTLAEALWLHAAGTCDDLLVAYPTVDRGALRALAADDQARQHVTIMADSEAHLDVVDRVLRRRPPGDQDLPGPRRLLAPAGPQAGGAHRHPAVPAAHAGAGGGLRPGGRPAGRASGSPG